MRRVRATRQPQRKMHRWSPCSNDRREILHEHGIENVIKRSAFSRKSPLQQASSTARCFRKPHEPGYCRVETFFLRAQETQRQCQKSWEVYWLAMRISSEEGAAGREDGDRSACRLALGSSSSFFSDHGLATEGTFSAPQVVGGIVRHPWTV